MSDVKKNNEKEFFQNIPVHFILCTERTGSSMLTAMLNEKPEILSTSEELFALYFYKKYKNKKYWTEKEIDRFLVRFNYLSEKNLKMYFSEIDMLRKNMLKFKEYLPYQDLIRLIYVHFLDLKDKSGVKLIVDKQIKYLYHLKMLNEVFPDSKFIVLTRDVRDNIISRKERKMNKSANYLYLSAIWNDTYKNVPSLLEKFPERVLLVRYEELVTHPEEELKKISFFLGVSFDKNMLRFHEHVNAFMDAKRESVGEDFYNRLKDFHSGMLQPVSTSKIGVWKNVLDKDMASKIAGVCNETGKQLGYDYSQPYGIGKLSAGDHVQIFWARCKRYHLLRFYLWLPLPVKIFIKKLKGKKITEA